jgi:hypothetical protein
MAIITNKNNTFVESETRLNSGNLLYSAGQNLSSVLHENLQFRIFKCCNSICYFISVKFCGNNLNWMSAA